MIRIPGPYRGGGEALFVLSRAILTVCVSFGFTQMIYSLKGIRGASEYEVIYWRAPKKWIVQLKHQHTTTMIGMFTTLTKASQCASRKMHEIQRTYG
jgi:hypothetical protein